MAIVLTKATKRYRSIVALAGVSLSIENGQVFGLVGPNGAGKSTLIDLLVGFRHPTAGQIKVLGLDPVSNPRSVKSRVGILPDGFTVNPRWTGRRHLQFATESTDSGTKPTALGERVGIASSLDQGTNEYSKGMCQRLGLAMALVGEPDLLILDEPSTGLDPGGMERVRSIIETERDRGATVLFSSHRLRQVESVADHVGVLVDGEIVDRAPVEEIRLDDETLVQASVDGLHSSLETIREMDGVKDVRRSGRNVEVLCIQDSTTDVLSELDRCATTVEAVDVSRRSLEDYYKQVME